MYYETEYKMKFTQYIIKFQLYVRRNVRTVFADFTRR